MPSASLPATSAMPAANPHVPYSVAARELLRNTLLDAACHELQQRPWADITMAHVAAAAGVSRQTLYNEFGSREQFAQILLMREATSFLAAVEEAVNQHLHDPATALAAAFDVFLTAAASNPLVSAIVRGHADELLALATTHGKPLVHSATERLTAVMVAGWPFVKANDVAILSECLVRLAISYAALPAGPANMTATSVAALLAPYVERLVEQAQPA